MRWILKQATYLVIAVSGTCVSVMAQHNHGGHDSAKVEAPKIFLDKSPKIIEYQLKRLTNEQLLLVERKSDDPKTIPVHSAIAARLGISLADRKNAIESLAQIQKSTLIAEVMKVLDKLEESSDNQRIAYDLGQIMSSQSNEQLSAQSEALKLAIDGKSSYARRAAWASILLAESEATWSDWAYQNEQRQLDFSSAIPWIGAQDKRNSLRSPLVRLMMEGKSVDVQIAAIKSLETIDSEATDSFTKLATLFPVETLRQSVIHSMLRIPVSQRDPLLIASLAKELVSMAEATPAAKRTEDSFYDAIQLVDGFLPQLDVGLAKEYRKRLDAISVRVIRMTTVIEEMRYDLKHFAVEAGRPTQLILKNEDLMPHNLVITAPGKLKDIALLAATMAPDEAPDGKQYVPKSADILFATGMVSANKQENLTFTAPSEPGEYPYVCTFPNHWLRMYGVMVVVKDLDAWLKDPQTPKDPIGNNRSFVKNWKLHDLESEIESGTRGRSDEIGARLFKEATCAQCHPIGTEGRNIGPSLTDVATRWKGDKAGILREILEPSHKIDPKFASYSVLTEDGVVYSGILVSESRESISILSGADQKDPKAIAREDISNMAKSALSIMPNGLMDQYTKDEIFELLAYLLKQKQ
jgi:putative heme-binding domain-containing protein